MARWSVGWIVLAFLLAGCAGKPPREALGGLPNDDLPDRILLEGATVLHQNASSLMLEWQGSIAGQDSLDLHLPGTHWLALEAKSTLGGEGLRLVDDYGRTRCQSGVDEPCQTIEVAPLGWDRTFTLELLASEAVDRLVVAVQIRAGDLPAVPESLPAGLDRIEPVEAVAEDGIALRGHVYIPRGSGPFATLLEFTPYLDSGVGDASDSQAIAVGDRRSIRWASHGPLGPLLDAGFAVALVTLRGTGTSDGCQTWFDLERDGKDAAAVIATLSEQTWSNGNVGMVGISWHGYSQYAAMGQAPPALKATAPSSAILDHWTIWTRNGAPFNYLGQAVGVPVVTGSAFHALYTLDNGGYLGPVQNIGSEGYVERVTDPTGPEHLACPDYAEQNSQWTALATTGDDAPYWQTRAAHRALATSGIPAFVTNGLLPFPLEGHITQIDGLWPLLPAGSVLMVGPWSHQFPSDRHADRYDRMLIDWFDQHLRGGPARVPPGVLYQDGGLAWHKASAWPPAATSATLWLSGDTLATDVGEVEPGTSMFVSREGTRATPDDCPFQATYVSPPLAEDILLAGNGHVDLTLTATAPDGNLAVVVWAVDEGFDLSCDATDGRVAGHVARAVTDLRHRGHLRTGSPFPIGAPDGISMDTQPFAAYVKAGQRLVVAVGGDAGHEVLDKPVYPVVTVHNDGSSLVMLPVVAGTLRF